jgi:hypothetical protein
MRVVQEYDARKIRDAELREFASRLDEEEQRSVIVELGVPSPRLELNKQWPIRKKESPTEAESAVNLQRTDLADVEGNSGAMATLERAILAIGIPNKPIRLNAAHAFVMDVTPAQLRAISASSLVGGILRNRKHFVPPRG